MIRYFILLLLIGLVLCSCGTTEEKKIIKVDENFGISSGIEDVYVTTAYKSRLLPNPDSNQPILRIPKNTKLKVLESRDVQQGRMLNKWYKVRFNNREGWTSGFNMVNQPELRILSVDEMYNNYEKKIGKSPVNNPLTGKIPEVDGWLKKNYQNYDNIEYTQWYKPFVIENQWICRVQYDEKINGIVVKEDLLFYFENGRVVDVGNFAD